MKRFYILLAVLACSITACDTQPTNEVNNNNPQTTIIDDFATGEDFYSFVTKDWEIDDNAFVEALVSSGLEQDFYFSETIFRAEDFQAEIDSYTEQPWNTKFVFSEDGTCRHYSRVKKWVVRNSLFFNVIGGTSGYVYMESEPLRWEYHADENKLITFDEYGNSSTAIILYFDNSFICYQGAIGREAQSLSYNKDVKSSRFHNSEYGMVHMVEDRSCWSCDEPESMEVFSSRWVDKDDQRALMIQEAEAERGEIDDAAFLDKLCNSAIDLTFESYNEDGCPYIRTYVYAVKDDFMIHSGPQHVLNHLMVFMDDGTARCCEILHQYTWACAGLEEKTEGMAPMDKVYVTCEWRYDADTNTIFSYNDRAQAEVIYFDGDIAILKGDLFGGLMNDWPNGGDYDYFFFDFSRMDRAEVLEEYSTDITEYVSLRQVE